MSGHLEKNVNVREISVVRRCLGNMESHSVSGNFMTILTLETCLFKPFNNTKMESGFSVNKHVFV